MVRGTELDYVHRRIERDQGRHRRAIVKADSQISIAQRLSEPIIAQFCSRAVEALDRERVWCKDAWPLPDGEVSFELNRNSSSSMRRLWNIHGVGFLSLTKRGVLLIEGGIGLGGSADLKRLKDSNWSDYGMRPRLFYNTDTSALLVVGAHGYGPDQFYQIDFPLYGARAVRKLIAAWHARED